MAYANNELFVGTTRNDFPRVKATYVAPKTFAPVGGKPSYACLTPVSFNTATKKWVVWTNGGANGTGTIKGFVYVDGVDLDDTDDVIGNVMLAGEIHRDDVVLPTGELQANLDAALIASNLRAVGIQVQGLAGVY